MKMNLKEKGRDVSGQRPVAEYRKCNNLSGSIKDDEFFNQLSSYLLLKKDSAPGNYLICPDSHMTL
jgi:hypothetical protein